MFTQLHPTPGDRRRMQSGWWSCITPLLLTLFAIDAQAGFVGLHVEHDEYGIDGVTKLSDIPGYAGQKVINIYAVFDFPGDQATGVVGAQATPFHVETMCGGGFINSPIGSDTPPSTPLVNAFPELNWDSYITIGLRTTTNDDALIVLPGTPGPNDNPWGDGGMGWTVPPTVNGQPTPQSLAGKDGRVLIMRLAVEPNDTIDLTLGLLVVTQSGPAQIAATLRAASCDSCDADVSNPADGVVNVQDLVAVILDWGNPGGTADANGDGLVNVQDLIEVILAWGEC